MYWCPDCGGKLKDGKINNVKVCKECNKVWRKEDCWYEVYRCFKCGKVAVMEDEDFCWNCENIRNTIKQNGGS